MFGYHSAKYTRKFLSSISVRQLFICRQAILSGSSRYGLQRIFVLMPDLRKHVWFRRLGLYSCTEITANRNIVHEATSASMVAATKLESDRISGTFRILFA